MLPGEYNLILYRGDTRVIPIGLAEEGDPPTPHDITGLDWNAQVREDHESEVVKAEFSIEVTNAAQGELNVVLPAEEARKLLVGGGVWDLQSTDAEGFVQTWVYGTVSVMPDVTRLGA